MKTTLAKTWEDYRVWYGAKRLRWIRRAGLLSPFGGVRAAARRAVLTIHLPRSVEVDWCVYLLAKLRGTVE